MISLALRKKLAVTEDPVTAAFIDLFRYEPDAALLGTILQRSRPVRNGEAIPSFDEFRAELWPDLEEREPDARITLLSGRTVVASVLIESKLGASKSSYGDLDVEEHGGDQLAVYLRNEARRVSPTRAMLIYLTHHAAMPKDDLEESIRHLVQNGHDNLAPNLFWLSWRDTHEVLERNAPKSRQMLDVVELLQRVQMFRFRAIDTSEPLRLDGMSSFYSGQTRARRYVDATRELGQLSPLWSYQGARSMRSYKWTPFAGSLTTSKFYKETA